MSDRLETDRPILDPAEAEGGGAALARHPELSLALLLALFFAALFPTLSELARYHGDERYYTDAALTMMRSGDYITPRYAGGAERFNKPPLTYWILCATYKLFGIGLVSSRLPFLLASCGVVWLTWRLGRVLFASVEAALLGAVIMAANVQTMTIATRSTPDMFLCLFVTLSLCGFAEVLLRKERGWRSYAMAYVGAGMACATKGLWGGIPVLFAAVLWALQHRQTVPLRRFAPAGWVLAGALVGLSWFVFAAVKHGGGTLTAFVRDQTAATATPVKWFLISNIGDYALATLRHFIPWSLALAAGWIAARPLIRESMRANRPVLWFVLGWYVLVFGIFAFGFMRRTRYLLPTYPGLAVLIGALLIALLRDGNARQWIRRLGITMLSVGVALGAGMALVGSRLDWNLVVAGCIVATSSGGLLPLARKADSFTAMAAFGPWVIVVFALITGVARPVFEKSPAPDLTRELSAPAVVGRPIAALGVPAAIVSQVRVLSGGRLDPKEFPVAASPGASPPETVWIVPETAREKFEPANYRLIPAGFRAKGLRARDVWRAWRSGARDDLFRRSRQNFYVAIRS